MYAPQSYAWNFPSGKCWHWGSSPSFHRDWSLHPCVHMTWRSLQATFAYISDTYLSLSNTEKDSINGKLEEMVWNSSMLIYPDWSLSYARNTDCGGERRHSDHLYYRSSMANGNHTMQHRQKLTSTIFATCFFTISAPSCGISPAAQSANLGRELTCLVGLPLLSSTGGSRVWKHIDINRSLKQNSRDGGSGSPYLR